ncbi:unnamed protein product [Effrenium voratum]|nr:unnamed protein product [Effrenium voratum]
MEVPAVPAVLFVLGGEVAEDIPTKSASSSAVTTPPTRPTSWRLQRSGKCRRSTSTARTGSEWRAGSPPTASSTSPCPRRRPKPCWMRASRWTRTSCRRGPSPSASPPARLRPTTSSETCSSASWPSAVWMCEACLWAPAEDRALLLRWIFRTSFRRQRWPQRIRALQACGRKGGRRNAKVPVWGCGVFHVARKPVNAWSYYHLFVFPCLFPPFVKLAKHNPVCFLQRFSPALPFFLDPPLGRTAGKPEMRAR